MIRWLEGKKTYIIAAVTFVVGGLQALGVELPPWVTALLVGLGLAALRQGVTHAGT